MKVELPASVLEEHANVQSSLYEVKPADSVPNRGAEIASHLDRIKQKLARVERLERERSEAHMRKQWEQYELRRGANLSDFKRPLTTALLTASAVYVSCHALWWYLEREKRVEELAREQAALAAELQDALQRQAEDVQRPTGHAGGFASRLFTVPRIWPFSR